MMVNHVQYWEVWDNFSGDGRDSGYNRTLACFSTKIKATKFAIGKGNYGQNAQVTQKEVFIIDDENDAVALAKTKAKSSALNKLTKEEKDALGIVE